MKFKIVSIFLFIYAIVGMIIMVNSEHGNDLTYPVIIYAIVFVLVPLACAISLWKRLRIGVIVSLLFFISQAVRLIGADKYLPLNPPISLGVPFGDFSQGNGYLIDFMSIFLIVYLLFLLKTDKQSTKV